MEFNYKEQNMKKLLVLSIAIMLAQISAESANQQKVHVMTEVMQSWDGYTLDEIMNHWGFPSEEKTIAGKKLCIWRNANTEYIHSTYTDTYSKVNLYCERIIEVDDSYNVKRLLWEGNNCPANHYAIAYSAWVNPEKSYFKLKKEEKERKKQEKLQKKLQKKLNKN